MSKIVFLSGQEVNTHKKCSVKSYIIINNVFTDKIKIILLLYKITK